MQPSDRTRAQAVGPALRGAREVGGWTLADVAGVPEPSLSRLERGLADPRLSTVQRVAAALGQEVSLTPVGRGRGLKEVAREARSRIEAAGLGESDPWARLARRRRREQDTAVEARARRQADRRP